MGLTPLIGQQSLMKMLDSLEQVLHAEAELAGIFSHPTLIGSAREFFVSRILGSILPKSVSVESGQVLHQNGRLSKQLDVVIYDDRFPCFRFGHGVSQFLAEGVAASIEVKSNLDKNALEHALSVSTSVIPEEPLESGSHVEKQISEYADRIGIPNETARLRLSAMMVPKTFIYAYKTSIDEETFLDTVWNSLEKYDRLGLIEPRLPRVIVAGDLLAISNDEHHRIDFNISEQDSSALQRKGHPVRIMSLFRTNKSFGMLASVLLLMLMERLRPVHGVSKLRWISESHIPIGLYTERLLSLSSWHLIAHIEEGTSDVTSHTKLKIAPSLIGR